MKHKVIVAGHVCIDITPIFPKTGANRIDDYFTPGKLINMNGVDLHTGGAVSNTGLGLQKLGADVSLMGKVGDDELGNIILNMFSIDNLQQDMIQSNKCSTSYSVVLAPPDYDRIFLHDSGANDTFGYDDLDFEKIKTASLFHFGYPPLMRGIYENDGSQLHKIFEKVKSMGIVTSLDMAAVDEASDAGRVDWERVLQRVIPFVDFFVPSVEELSYMIDRDLYHIWKKRAGNKDMTLFIREDEIDSLCDRLLEWGAKIIVIKCGAAGMYIKTASYTHIAQMDDTLMKTPDKWSDIAHFEPSYIPEIILSGTGAGDTSIAAFLYGFLLGYSWRRCMQLAVATGASCLGAYDAISGIGTIDELTAKIDAGWEKQYLLLK